MEKSKIQNPKSKTNPKSKIQNPNRSLDLSFKDSFVIWILSLVVCGILVTGCEQIDQESLSKIAQDDPAFKEVLEKKQGLDSKIALLSKQLSDVKAMTDANIRAIQENFNKQKNDIDSKISVLKKELDPERLVIRQHIDSLKQEISTRKGMLKNLETTKKNLSNLIGQQKAVTTTDKEMSEWRERLADLDSQIGPLAGEIMELEEKAKVLRLKLIALRQ